MTISLKSAISTGLILFQQVSQAQFMAEYKTEFITILRNTIHLLRKCQRLSALVVCLRKQFRKCSIRFLASHIRNVNESEICAFSWLERHL